MKNPPEDRNPNATIQIDAAEAAEIVLDESNPDIANIDSGPPGSRKTAPPPLPPGLAAPPVPAIASVPPMPRASLAPPEAPSSRRYVVFGLILVGALGLALLLGAKLAPLLRGAPPPTASAATAKTAATPARTAAVISIPVVEVADTDGGP